jgi:hypothetical protein
MVAVLAVVVVIATVTLCSSSCVPLPTIGSVQVMKHDPYCVSVLVVENCSIEPLSIVIQVLSLYF